MPGLVLTLKVLIVAVIVLEEVLEFGGITKRKQEESARDHPMLER